MPAARCGSEDRTAFAPACPGPVRPRQVRARRIGAHPACPSSAAMPADTLRLLREALPGAEIGDAGATILAVRERKSDQEIAAARRGAAVADLAFEKSLEIIRPGLDERQWRAAVEGVMTASGADGGFNMLECRPGRRQRGTVSRLRRAAEPSDLSQGRCCPSGNFAACRGVLLANGSAGRAGRSDAGNP